MSWTFSVKSTCFLLVSSSSFRVTIDQTPDPTPSNRSSFARDGPYRNFFWKALGSFTYFFRIFLSLMESMALWADIACLGNGRAHFSVKSTCFSFHHFV